MENENIKPGDELVCTIKRWGGRNFLFNRKIKGPKMGETVTVVDTTHRNGELLLSLWGYGEYTFWPARHFEPQLRLFYGCTDQNVKRDV